MTKSINEWLQENCGEHPYSVVFTNIFAAIFGVAIVYFCLSISDIRIEQTINLLIAMLGALLGWALGMFFAPYNRKDQAKFVKIGQATSAFVSGYLVSKLDRFLESSLFAGESPEPVAWIRIGILFCSTLLILITVFSNRLYFGSSDDDEQNKTNLDL